MAGLEPHLYQDFRKEFRGKVTKLGMPSISIYADDLVVVHPDREVVEWSATAIAEYLAGLGLRLSPQKTKIVHTMQVTGSEAHAGFDFLGFHIQHHVTIKPGGHKVPYLVVRPSRDAVNRFYRDIAKYVDLLKLSRKHRGARQHRTKSGKKDPVSVMIIHLNRMIRGWANYYRYSNATETFSRVDHKIHTKLRGWAKRRFSNKSAGWIKRCLFSGIELDDNGTPLKRKDGTPRNREWAFTSPFAKCGPTLRKLADTGISKQILVQPGKSYYDGDWPYWQLRLKRSRYYASPVHIGAAAFRRQKGRCADCEELIQITDTCLTVTHEGQRQAVIVHKHCSMSHSPSVTRVVASSSTC
jgi:RNA-directed DNA polymerase